jgi:hypothetical protein
VFDSILDLFGLICVGGFWLGFVYIKNDARIRLATIQRGDLNGTTGSQDIRALRDEVAELRKQLNELRETSTAYDLSFDTALRRIEHQVETELMQRSGVNRG